ncbi:cytochrome P450 [Mycena alexandri]|uniref:Cytochrome P450 n=1 Tax=Mycena alexandri TaxID=1745969 RepID=A0AAD6XDK2_9AGAR|nr:cytochrome P450 [Mycena alexandri]
MLQTSFVYYVVPLFLAYLLWNVLSKPKDAFPSIGPSGPISSFIGAFQFLTQGRRMVHEGYTKYAGRVFRVPGFTHWTHVVSGLERTREVVSAPDTELSLDDAANETFQLDYTMGTDMAIHPYGTRVIRGALTQNLARRFEDVRDEISCAFEDVLTLEGTEWQSVTAYTAVLNIVCRTSNRLFVGLPLCRSPEWIALNIQFTIDVAIAGQLIGILPTILKPVFGPFLTSRKRNLRQGEKLIGPLIQERLDDPSSSHNDLISWLLDAAPVDGRRVTPILERVLGINFAAIHTSSMVLTHALFDLAVHPECAAPLREEAARVVAADGWTKAALGKMHKIDSFLRESLRMNGLGITTVGRRVTNRAGFRFADGTTIPHGEFLEIAVMDTHHDPTVYDAPDTFDGFRFSRLRDGQPDQQERGGVFKHGMVTTSLDYLPFGHGRHACPGRFFAATELKAMIAHVVLNYDVKLDSADGKRPPDAAIGAAHLPNRTAKLWFRRRSEAE